MLFAPELLCSANGLKRAGLPYEFPSFDRSLQGKDRRLRRVRVYAISDIHDSCVARDRLVCKTGHGRPALSRRSRSAIFQSPPGTDSVSARHRRRRRQRKPDKCCAATRVSWRRRPSPLDPGRITDLGDRRPSPDLKMCRSTGSRRLSSPGHWARSFDAGGLDETSGLPSQSFA